MNGLKWTNGSTGRGSEAPVESGGKAIFSLFGLYGVWVSQYTDLIAMDWLINWSITWMSIRNGRYRLQLDNINRDSVAHYKTVCSLLNKQINENMPLSEIFSWYSNKRSHMAGLAIILMAIFTWDKTYAIIFERTENMTHSLNAKEQLI